VFDADAPGAGAVDRLAGESADGAGAGQLGLAQVFRPRHRGNAGRFRHAGRATVAPRTARLAGDRVHASSERRDSFPPLVSQIAAPADRDVSDVPPVVKGPAGTAAA